MKAMDLQRFRPAEGGLEPSLCSPEMDLRHDAMPSPAPSSGCMPPSGAEQAARGSAGAQGGSERSRKISEVACSAGIGRASR